MRYIRSKLDSWSVIVVGEAAEKAKRGHGFVI